LVLRNARPWRILKEGCEIFFTGDGSKTVSEQSAHQDVLQQLLEADQEGQRRVKQAHQEAQRIVDDARREAESRLKQAREQAEQEAGQIAQQAQNDLQDHLGEWIRQALIESEAQRTYIANPNALREHAATRLSDAVDLLVAWVTGEQG
jgi:F0F1-type ATP synthase membrane subunit b/b'